MPPASHKVSLQQITAESATLQTYPLAQNENIIKTADKLDISLLTGTINTSDLFYNELSDEEVFVEDCLAVEMETFALFFLANKLKKEATSVLTVTDHLITNEKVSSKERETGLDKAITLILESL